MDFKKKTTKRVVGSILSPLGYHNQREESGRHALLVATIHLAYWSCLYGHQRSAHGQTLYALHEILSTWIAKHMGPVGSSLHLMNDQLWTKYITGTGRVIDVLRW